MRTKLIAIAVLGLIAGGTALAFTLTGKTAQADTQTVPAPVQAVEAAGCCVTGECCCPGQGSCCAGTAMVSAKAEAKACCAAKTEKNGDCCEK